MGSVFPELPQLGFGVLSRFVSRDTSIDGGALRFAGHVESVLSERHDEQIQKGLCRKTISVILTR